MAHHFAPNIPAPNAPFISICLAFLPALMYVAILTAFSLKEHAVSTAHVYVGRRRAHRRYGMVLDRTTRLADQRQHVDESVAHGAVHAGQQHFLARRSVDLL